MGFFSGIKKALKKIASAFVKPFKAISNSLKALVSPNLGSAASIPRTVAVKSADRLKQRMAISRSGLVSSSADADSLTEEYLGLPSNYPDAPVTLGSVHRQHQTLGS